MRKLSCFFLSLFLFFNMSFFSFALDVSTVVRSYSPIVGYGFSRQVLVDGKYITNGGENGTYVDAISTSSSGSVFVIPVRDLVDGKITISNPQGASIIYSLWGSSSPSVLDSVSRPSSGRVVLPVSGLTLLGSFSSSLVVTSHTIDASSYLSDWDYLYVSCLKGGGSVTLNNVTASALAYVNPPSPSPSVSPSPPIGGSDTLEDYTFWATCFNQTWKNGSSASKDVIQRIIPTTVANLSSDVNGIFNYVYTYPVRIPFRVECSNFLGEGYFDAGFRFNLDVKIMGLKMDGTDGISYLIDNSTPWVESVDSISFNAAGNFSNGFGMDVINMPLHVGTSAEFYYCTNVYVSLSSNHQFTGYGDYIDVTLSNLSFDVLSSIKVSDFSATSILDKINNNIEAGNQQDKNFHDEEVEEANKAIEQMQDGVGELTGVLSKWEIVTMPITFVKDFAGAITSEGSTGLTFPSFTLMGYQLWPSYSFDLNVIKDKFPLLYNSLHVITGIMVVGWFLHYLWRKWHLLTGDDTPEV